MRVFPGFLVFFLLAGLVGATPPAPQPPKKPTAPKAKNPGLDGGSLFNKGRDLAASGNLAAAIEAYKAIPPTDPKAPLAAVQIRELKGKLERQGRGTDREAESRGAEQEPGSDSAASGSNSSGASASLAGRLQSAFALRSVSPTLRSVVNKAAKNGAASFEDLEKAGIHFAMGAPGQKDAVLLKEENGRQVVTLSPSVFASGKKERVAAQLGRGLEEAATQRDYDGLSEWLRKVGGRLVAVKVLIEVAVQDAGIVRTPGADQRLLDDRAAVAKSKSMSGAIELGNVFEGFDFVHGLDIAKKEGFLTPLNVFLYFGAKSEGATFSPRDMPEADKPYVMTLHGAMP